MLIDYNVKLKIIGKETESKMLFIDALNNINFREGTNMKKAELAEKIFKDEKINVDRADFELIKQAVSASTTILPIAKGHLEKYLADIKFE